MRIRAVCGSGGLAQPASESPENESDVVDKSSDGSVMSCHDAVSLSQRAELVSVGETVGKVVYGDHVEVEASARVGFFDAAYGPVVVGREAILQIIVRCDLTAHHERLVAHQHPPGK